MIELQKLIPELSDLACKSPVYFYSAESVPWAEDWHKAVPPELKDPVKGDMLPWEGRGMRPFTSMLRALRNSKHIGEKACHAKAVAWAAAQTRTTEADVQRWPNFAQGLMLVFLMQAHPDLHGIVSRCSRKAKFWTKTTDDELVAGLVKHRRRRTAADSLPVNRRSPGASHA